jgi:hypothetical protein
MTRKKGDCGRENQQKAEGKEWRRSEYNGSHYI